MTSISCKKGERVLISKQRVAPGAFLTFMLSFTGDIRRYYAYTKRIDLYFSVGFFFKTKGLWI